MELADVLIRAVETCTVICTAVVGVILVQNCSEL